KNVLSLVMSYRSNVSQSCITHATHQLQLSPSFTPEGERQLIGRQCQHLRQVAHQDLFGQPLHRKPDWLVRPGRAADPFPAFPPQRQSPFRDGQRADGDCTNNPPAPVGPGDCSAEPIHRRPDPPRPASDRATQLPTPDDTGAPSDPPWDRPSAVVVPRPAWAGAYSTPRGADPARSTTCPDRPTFGPARLARSCPAVAAR